MKHTGVGLIIRTKLADIIWAGVVVTDQMFLLYEDDGVDRTMHNLEIGAKHVRSCFPFHGSLSALHRIGGWRPPTMLHDDVWATITTTALTAVAERPDLIELLEDSEGYVRYCKEVALSRLQAFGGKKVLVWELFLDD